MTNKRGRDFDQQLNIKCDICGKKIGYDIIAHNAKHKSPSVTHLILLDISASMEGEPFEKCKAIVNDYFWRLRLTDKFGLIVFGAQVAVKQKPCPVERVKIKAVLDSITLSTSARLYDALLTACDLAKGKTKVTVLTDGHDTHSKVSYEGCLEKVRETHDLEINVFHVSAHDYDHEPFRKLATSYKRFPSFDFIL